MSTCACGCGRTLLEFDRSFDSPVGRLAQACYARMLRKGDLPPRSCLDCGIDIKRRARRCADCSGPHAARYAREKAANHHAANRADSNWGRQVRNWSKFGLTRDGAIEALDAQGGACAICAMAIDLEPGPRTKQDKAVADHDHRTNSFRGLLCRGCNTGLGHFADDPSLLEEAARYLRYHLLLDGPSAPLKGS